MGPASLGGSWGCSSGARQHHHLCSALAGEDGRPGDRLRVAAIPGRALLTQSAAGPAPVTAVADPNQRFRSVNFNHASPANLT